MVKRSARKAIKSAKRTASANLKQSPVKRHKANNEPLPGDNTDSAFETSLQAAVAPLDTSENIESDFISELNMDGKDIAQDPLPMPEDPLDKFARVLAAVGPNDNDSTNDLDIEDDLAPLSDEEIEVPALTGNKRWPLDESPEALTFSLLNVTPVSASTSSPISPSLTSSTSAVDSADNVPGLEFDDFIDYESCSSDYEQTGSGACSPVSEESVRRAPVVDKSLPLYFYRDRPEEEIPWLSEIDFKAKDILAAWSSVAPGIDPCAKASYIRNVVFAAASLNPTSLASGRARQTMAPAAPPTVDI